MTETYKAKDIRNDGLLRMKKLKKRGTPKRKPPKPNDMKIEPNDKKNWSDLHIKFDEECVILFGDCFGEPDTEHMIVISNDQWEKLKAIKI